MKLIPVFDDGDNKALVCPVCRFDFVHPIALKCTPAGHSGKEIVVAHDGVHERPARPEDDGVAITLRFLCENGHVFAYRLHFHEGHTFVSTEARQDPEAIERLKTIWRT